MVDIVEYIAENRSIADDNQGYLDALQQAIALVGDVEVEGIEEFSIVADRIVLKGDIVLSDGVNQITIAELLKALKFVEYLREATPHPGFLK